MDLLSLKKKHKKVICVPIMGIEIYFTLLNWGQYKTYVRLLQLGVIDRVRLYDHLFKENVLNEDIVDKMYSMPAGLVDSVVELMFRLSGNPLFEEEDIKKLNQDIDIVRSTVQNNIFDQFIVVICRAFPSYTPHDLDELDWQEFLRLLLLAEAKLKSTQSQITAVSEGQFVSQQWPGEATVNVKPKKEEKQESDYDRIMKDTRSLMAEDPRMAMGEEGPRSKKDFELLKRHKMMEMAKMRKEGRMPSGGRA